jgi:DNA-binding GntR family transcriptional regulator
VLIGIRTLVNPADPNDVATVHALEDALKVEQPGKPGKFELPNWDKESQGKVRAALLELGKYTTDTSRAFGTKEEVDPVAHLIAGEWRQPRHRPVRHAPAHRPRPSFPAEGIGTRVEERTARSSGFQQSLASVDDVVQFAEATVRDFRSVETVMDQRMAQEFNCKPGSRWIKVSYVRTKANGDSQPIGWVDVYIDERFEGVRSALRDYRGMYGTLIEKQYGVHIVEIQQEVRGSLVPEELAEALEAKPGSHALQVVYRYLNRKAELVEFTVSVHQADRYVVSSSLQRVAEAPQDR